MESPPSNRRRWLCSPLVQKEVRLRFKSNSRQLRFIPRTVLWGEIMQSRQEEPHGRSHSAFSMVDREDPIKAWLDESDNAKRGQTSRLKLREKLKPFLPYLDRPTPADIEKMGSPSRTRAGLT